ELWDQRLAYFVFEVKQRPQSLPSGSTDKVIDELLDAEAITLVPQQYEDFFGHAATNIFNSNIGLEDVTNVGVAKPDSQTASENALDREVVNMYDYYEEIQQASWQRVCQELGFDG